MPTTLKLPHGEIKLPAFFPDATYGVVRSVDFNDVKGAGIEGVVMNSMHIASKPGLKLIKKFGGINKLVGFDRPVLTDSGGFQVFSLIRENRKYGEIRKNEVIFYPNMGKGGGSTSGKGGGSRKSDKSVLTPQKSIQNQFAMRSDIVVCLDYCTHPDDSAEIQAKSVETTLHWAEICKKEYEIQLKNYKYTDADRPLLFAVIQGGSDKGLRKICAEGLVRLGFDGYGFGGWPVDSSGNLVMDTLKYTAEMMPDGMVKYAMGLGKPDEIAELCRHGYNLFDCVIPTREARRGRLYAFTGDDLARPFYKHVYIMDDTHAVSGGPICAACRCYACQNFGISFIRHLFKVGDPLAYRLATIHNLSFYAELMERIRCGPI